MTEETYAALKLLRDALAPFSVIGGLIELAGGPDSIPDETVASYMRLDGLTALEFREAHKAFLATNALLAKDGTSG